MRQGYDGVLERRSVATDEHAPSPPASFGCQHEAAAAFAGVPGCVPEQRSVDVRPVPGIRESKGPEEQRPGAGGEVEGATHSPPAFGERAQHRPERIDHRARPSAPTPAWVEGDRGVKAQRDAVAGEEAVRRLELSEHVRVVRQHEQGTTVLDELVDCLLLTETNRSEGLEPLADSPPFPHGKADQAKRCKESPTAPTVGQRCPACRSASTAASGVRRAARRGCAGRPPTLCRSRRRRRVVEYGPALSTRALPRSRAILQRRGRAQPERDCRRRRRIRRRP